MARINNISTLVQGIKTVPELARFVASALENILTQFNGKVDFGDNIRTFGPTSVTFSNTLPTKIEHGLGRTPVGFILTSIDAAAIVYVPSLTSFPWNETQVFLQCDTSDVTASVMLF